MIIDLNAGGVLIPGLLIIVFAAFFCTLVAIRLFAFSAIYRLLPCRSLANIALFFIILALMKQGLNATGF